MGSIMIDRTDDDITIFPKNVSRVKIYPSVVNFIKQTWAPPRILKRGLTNKQLNTYANNVCDKYLSSFTSPECIQYKDIFMAFRIECTMQLVDGHSSLDELNQQFDEMMIDILTKLQPVIRVTMIAIEDISNMAKFCLSRYYKMCIGKSSTIFRDQKMARAMVLSLWQVSGYHCHKATTNAHKTYLFDIDMDDMVNELKKEEAEKKRIAAEELKKELEALKAKKGEGEKGAPWEKKKKKKKKVKVEGGYDGMDL